MKLETKFVVTCCNFGFESDYEYHAIEALFYHIKEKHPKRFLNLIKKGRKAAMSQNGLGYYDDGKSKDGEWFDADKTEFREAWMQHALKEQLKNQ